jgi:phosphohistidine phosphatase SixA
MNRLRTLWNRWLFSWLLVLLGLAPALANASELNLATRLQQGGHVLMMRHAYAPGFGDPPGFKLDDCSTQRNLDTGGRAQATAIGDWLRRQGVRGAQVYSSQWCRNLETARLLNLGPVTPLPALNSFFEREQDRVGILVALNAFLARQPADGPLLILVTHFVNIEAIAGSGVGSGEAVLLQLKAGTSPRVIGRVDFTP